MRIDLYTKFVLTVIALCLIWLSVGGPAILPAAFAQQTSFGERVVITGWEDEKGQVTRFSRTKDISGRPIDNGGLPVAIVYGAR
jgi:hypothetical protein